jgi:hypothetical protein
MDENSATLARFKGMRGILLEQDFFFASGLNFVFPLRFVCSTTAKSNAAANIGYGKNEKTKYGCT